MKILAPTEIREADRLTIENEPIQSIDLMERAASAFVKHLLNDCPDVSRVHIFCGPGNNGGDGLAIARQLSRKTSPPIDVHAYILDLSSQVSDDHRINAERLSDTTVKLHSIRDAASMPAAPLDGILIDALFGSGLNRPLEGLSASVVELLNHPAHTVISVDIPSGLYADKPTEGPVVRADRTYTFQLPKLAFLLPDNAGVVPDWQIIDIGLLPSAIEALPTSDFYVTHRDVAALFRPRNKFAHKGNFGHALLLAGSLGKAGAAVLAARAALRSGLGLLTLHVPAAILNILQESVPEAMCSVDNGSEEGDCLSTCPKTDAYSAVGLGPGIGTCESTARVMSELFGQYSRPMVIDADGLNILAAAPALMDRIPAGSILTPHPGEFRRLAGSWENDYQKLDMLREMAARYSVHIVLKGAHTCIASPDGSLYFNSTGNSGMATAGSGDSLTGIITGLLAQGYPSRDAAVLGAFVHGLAGDIALLQQHESSLIASDIIRCLGQAFKHIEELP